MSNTKEFFVSVVQRIFSNWTALRVSTYFLKFAIEYSYTNNVITFYLFGNIFLLDGSGT